MKEDIKNCPNCGAPIEHRYNHQCRYCKTFFDYRIREVEEINPCYLKNLKVKCIEHEPFTGDIILIFKGDYVKWQEALEYSKNNTTILLSADDIKPKEINYAIHFDYFQFKELSENNFEPLYNALPFEIDKHIFMKAIYEFNERERI